MAKKNASRRGAKARVKASARRKAPARTHARTRKAATRAAGGAATWIVTASGDRPIEDVAKDLAKAGLTSSTVLGAVGSIIGSAPRGAAAKLKKVRGVAAVAADTPISLGPPDSPDTW